MLAGTDTLATIANHWLARFEHAVSARDAAALEGLFDRDSHWRDVLAFSWQIQTVSGAQAVARHLIAQGARAKPAGFRTDPQRTAPRHVTRAGTKCVEAIFRFETADGQASGVLRLLPDERDAPKGWTLLTALDELKGHEERVGRLPRYADLDPAVLVVGGGQAGLSIAARLGQLQVDTLIVDRWPRIGDNWRQRYDALTLHNQVHVNHLPYMPFPPNWPVYIPKDKLANWFEAYVEAMELNYWTATEFEGGSYVESAERWTVALRGADGSVRELHPRHVVLATGVSGIPHLPEIPTLGKFGGRVMHSSEYEDGETMKVKHALVINCDPSAQLVYGLYSEGPPLEDCDLITASVPLALARKTHQLATAHAKDLDRELLRRLERKGFRLSDGEEGTGWQFLYLTRGGGYYFNVGCSDLVADGKIGLAQFSDIAEFVAEGARMKDRTMLRAELIVLATGWKGQEHQVRKLFGAEVAARVGPVWGFGDGQELRNMFTRTAQPGLWFIAGSFAQSRIYSKYLALQIKASEAGLIAA